MLILLIKMHIYVLNQKSKVFTCFLVKCSFGGAQTNVKGINCKW